ncbi:MAG TPA: hypothetical protein VND99_02485, partial [Candidatus Acidoferrales bacterium]|nr:hypothetical protein [Candidatus Acidoferrales bacterium]
PQYLSGNEAHEWDIMPNGQYVDATPSTMTPAEARKVAEFLSENFGGKGLVDPAQQRQDQFLTLLEELGEMTIAAGVIWQRQRLLRGINRVGAWEANRRLENRPTESLQEVYDALNFALYSGKTERPSPAIRNEQDFLSAPPTRTELLALFARYARPDAYLEWLRGIKEKAGEMTDPEMSEQVREACAVIRNIHQFVSRTENAKKPTA